ncbi:MAG: SH3 domain-containing protein [Bauldia sp.]
MMIGQSILTRGLLVAALATAPLLAQPASAQDSQARVTSDLNARSGPGTNYAVLFVLPRNAVVSVFDCTPGPAWCQVSYQNRVGWASASYLAFGTGAASGVFVPAPQPAPPPVAGGQVQVRATAQLNMRTGPGTNYPSIGSIPANGVAVLTRCVEGYVWCEAQYAGRTGWVSARYLQSVSPQFGTQPVNVIGPQLGLRIFEFILGQLGVPQAPTPPPQPPRPGANEVCFYSDPGFQGQAFCARMGQADANLAAGWNDNISSIRVGQGAWVEVCSNANFNGVCRVFAENVQQLPNNLDNRISSYRTTQSLPAPGPGIPLPTPVGQVCFYADFNYTGPSFCLGRDQGLSNLGTEWNDRISSIRVDTGLSVQVCENTGYGGWCEEYFGNIPQLPPNRNDGTSSLRVR